MALAQDDEVVQALLLNRLNEALDEGVCVRRPESSLADRDSPVLKVPIDGLGL